MSMEIFTLITGPVDVNTYIVYGAAAGECVVIDPADTPLVNKALAKLALRPAAVLLTHGHFDHIISVADIQKQYGAKVYIHAADEAALRDARVNLCPGMGIIIPPCSADVILHGGETICEAGFEITVLNTPGHTKGSVTYKLEADNKRVLFTGDCLFRSSIGRSDFPGGDQQELLDSIGYQLFALEGDYKVYPGHMGSTTLQYERENNPFMRRWSRLK